MGYKKADEILPKEIVEMIQNYVDGEYLYIPRKKERRKSWGEQTDTRRKLKERNEAIRQAHQEGLSKQELAERYFLSEKSIERILYREK